MFFPPSDPGQNPGQKSGQKPGEKSDQKSGQNIVRLIARKLFGKHVKNLKKRFSVLPGVREKHLKTTKSTKNL